MCPICEKDFRWQDHIDGNFIESDTRTWHKTCAIKVLESLGSGEIESPQTDGVYCLISAEDTPDVEAGENQEYKHIQDWEPTPRGFMRAEFTDRFDKPCSIQKSSLATEDALWLGVNENRMHLTMELAEELWPILKRFAETGELTK